MIYNDLSMTSQGTSSLYLPELKSSLYRYQQETVSCMISMEEGNRVMDDPLYIPIHGLEGELMYAQPTVMEVFSACPQVEQGRGGILCEELGGLFFTSYSKSHEKQGPERPL